MRVVVVVGNPKSGGRTTEVARQVGTRLAQIGGGEVDIIELAEVAGRLFDPSASEVTELQERVTTADAAVFASPTYKAGITGLLKAFLDRYGPNGLAGLTAVPLMVGGVREHALAVETQLRPILVELAATTPTKGLFVVDSELDRLTETIDDWWALAQGPLRALLGPPSLDSLK
jgi:FMN reductase